MRTEILTLITRLRHSSETIFTSVSGSSINVMNVSIQIPRNLGNSAAELQTTAKSNKFSYQYKC